MDRSEGSTSLTNGQLELMVHRRMRFDDGERSLLLRNGSYVMRTSLPVGCCRGGGNLTVVRSSTRISGSTAVHGDTRNSRIT